MKFRPCIDLHTGVVKQIIGSTLVDDAVPKTNFESELSAADYAKMYQRDGLTGGHVIMLGSNEANKTAALQALAAYPNGLQIGGGITLDTAEFYLNHGASHVIVTSFVFRQGRIDFERLNQLVLAIGKHRLVLDLSCRKNPNTPDDDKYYVVTDRWQTFTQVPIAKDTIATLEQYCDEFLVHAVDVEGKRCGIQSDLVELLAESTTIPVTYAGGAKSLEDLSRVKELGKDKVNLSIGSALDIFGGSISYKQVVEWNKNN